jgi:hypothetical protein
VKEEGGADFFCHFVSGLCLREKNYFHADDLKIKETFLYISLE